MAWGELDFRCLGRVSRVLLAYERFRGKQSIYQALPRFVQVGITFVLVLFSWVLFARRASRRRRAI